MAFGTPTSTKKQSTDNTNVTSDAIDTTGYDLIVIGITNAGTAAATPTDSKGNTWTALTGQTGGGVISRFWYCINPTVGSGHTFSTSQAFSYPSIFVLAIAGAAAAGFDQQNGTASASATSIQPGSITPTEDNELVVALCTNDDTGNTLSINGGFTIAQQNVTVAFQAEGGGLAYLIQTTATAANPTWSWGGSSEAASTVIASFKAAAGGSTRGTPFGTRGTAFNGGRCLQGILR